MGEFKDFLFDKFLEWEKAQPKKRSSYSAFARYLSVNSLEIPITQPLLEGWINGRYKPGPKYIPVLAEILGLEVFDYLQIPRPDPLLAYITANWGKLPPSVQQTIHTQILEYLTRQADESEPSPTSP